MTREADRARQDFLAEAEELLESIARGIGELEQQGRRVRPAAVNDLFRAVHSLKGVSGMFGMEPIAKLSHRLEDLLDRLRLGKVEIGDPLIAVLTGAASALSTLLAWAAGGESGPHPDTSSILSRIETFGHTEPVSDGGGDLDAIDLDPQARRSLTEYEEHRLRENLRGGQNIFTVRVLYDFAEFDTRLHALSAALSERGEILSTLPSPDPTGLGIAFQLLFGTEATETDVRSVAGAGAEVRSLRKVGEPGVGGEAHEEQAEGLSIRSLSPTIRVDVAKLDTVMNIVGELFLARTRLETLVRALRSSADRSLSTGGERIARDVSRKLEALQQAVIDLRLVPVAQLYSRLARVARGVARELGKDVELITEGAETELDKMLVELAADPLMHIVRNAIDHGIEPAEERTRAGKPATAKLILRAYPRGSSVIIDVIDDGRGVDVEAVRKMGVSRGVIEEGASITRDEAHELLFIVGFSTAAEVSEFSGRGVGLDVVRSNIHEMKGSIEVFSEPGKGSTFRITLPITLAIVNALIVRSGREQYAIPLTAVDEVLRIDPKSVVTVGGREAVLVRSETIPLLRLADFGFSADRQERPLMHLVIARAGERKVALVVDAIQRQQEIVIKSVGERIRRVPGIAGATDIGDDDVALVLDVTSLAETCGAAARERWRSGA